MNVCASNEVKVQEKSSKIEEIRPVFKWFKVGIPRAVCESVLTNQTTATANSSHPAFETLVIAHLADIRKREADLQDRLRSGVEPLDVAAEVHKLRSSADRLSRFMDEMSFGDFSAALAV
jgi:hypothetical protein